MNSTRRSAARSALILESTLVLATLSVSQPSWSSPALQPHPKVILEIHASVFGSGAYRTGMAWEQIINNSKHPWLTATCRETLGLVENVVRVIDKTDPERRRRTIFVGGASTYYAAKNGLKPFKQSYKGKIRGVAILGGACSGFITCDPKIKKPQDLVGKKIALGPVSHTGTQWRLALLNNVWNLQGKCRLEYMTFVDVANTFRDGLVDVSSFSMQISKPVPIPDEAYSEMVQTKADKFHFISINKKDIDNLSQIFGYPMGFYEIPARAFGAGQTEPAGTVDNYSGCWWAAADADEEVIFEAVKIVCENASKFADYLGKIGLFDPKELGSLPITEEEMHPGAVRYYRAHGIKAGLM